MNSRDFEDTDLKTVNLTKAYPVYGNYLYFIYYIFAKKPGQERGSILIV